ncbi:MAG: glycosyltransferase family 4 protein [Rhodothermia bacterium]|nr:MAG: glycosyltransferase family 4 protein [Rhodothermia bacterium]
MSKPRVIVFGRFPPPVDGQSLSTERFVTMLDSEYTFTRINSSVPAEAGTFQKFASYRESGKQLRREISGSREECIVWQSISPQVTGHYRDRITVLPHLKRHRSIAVIHWGSFARVFQAPLTSASARRMVDRIAHFVFTDERLSDACAEWIPADRRSAIANSVDPGLLCSDEDVHKKPTARNDGSLRMLYLSNMIKEKGYLDVLQAGKLLNDQGLDVRIDFVGRWYSDTDRKEFEQLVESKKLARIVHHHGPIEDRATLKQFYLSADVFVFPTYYLHEAQPLCVIEAMSAGLPIVTTANGGIPNMVRDGEEGFVVPAQQPGAIAAAVCQLADDQTWLNCATNARRRFVERYHPGVIREQWVTLINSIHPQI